MNAPASTWANTPWGLLCASIGALVAADFPAIEIGIGPDAESLHKAPPALTFAWDGDAQIQRGVRGSPFDDVIPIRATAWMPDPVQADLAASSIVLAIDAVLHGRAGTPGRKVKPQGGDIGAAGAKMIVLFTLRLAIQRMRIPATVPTSYGLTAAATEGRLPPDEAILVP